jgi:hypothetical protein
MKREDDRGEYISGNTGSSSLDSSAIKMPLSTVMCAEEFADVLLLLRCVLVLVLSLGMGWEMSVGNQAPNTTLVIKRPARA